MNSSSCLLNDSSKPIPEYNLGPMTQIFLAINVMLLVVAVLGLFTESVSAATEIESAELIYPREEVALGSTQRFWWTRVDGADAYWLQLRDADNNTYSDYKLHPQSANNTTLYDLPDKPYTAELFTVTFHTVNGQVEQNWERVTQYHLNSAPAVITAPSSSQLTGPIVTFGWEEVPAARDYYIHISDHEGTTYFRGYADGRTSVTVDSLPIDQRQITVSIHTVIGSNWKRSSSRTFTASDSTAVLPPELPKFWTDFDYQIGGARTPASNVGIVSRDYTDNPAAGVYNICYVNAFQSQPGEESSWPAGSVTPLLDENWNEYLIDIRTASARQRAAAYVYKMIDHCANSGFDAVEFDNLDSYSRLGDSVDSAKKYTDYWFDMSDAVAYARLLSNYTHSVGLASAQKNTAELFPSGAHRQIGFDFAIVESCLGAQWDECETFANHYSDQILAIQYERFNTVCSTYGNRFPLVREDRDVVAKNPPGSFCN